MASVMGVVHGSDPVAEPRLARPIAAALATLTCVAVGITLVQPAGVLRDAIAVGTWLIVTAAVALALTTRVSGNPVGWLLATAATLLAVREAALAGALAVGVDSAFFGPLAWLSHWVAVPGAGSMAFTVLLFPTGRVAAPRWRWVGWVLAVGFAILATATAFAPGEVGGLAVANPVAWTGAGDLLLLLVDAAPWIVTVGVVGAFASLVERFRGARDVQRQQVRWFLAAVGFLGVALLFAGGVSGPLNELSFVVALLGLTAVPAAIGVAILEYRLYDLDRVVNRTLVYGGLTIAVIGLYAASVTVFAVVFDRALGVAASVAGTVVVALALQPIRGQLQRLVDRLVYGQRNDPTGALAALTTLAARLGDAGDPADLPDRIVATVAGSLKLGYVAIELVHDGDRRVLIETGTRWNAVEEFPITWRGETIGRLQVDGDGQLRARDQQLLRDLALAAAPGLAAVRLTADLERSRQHLVVVREEERRRLRADLHDGLGPQLAGLAMGLDAIDALVERDPEAAREAAGQLRARSREALETARAVARGLRPPALDDLGLVDALRHQLGSIGSGGVVVSLDVDDAIGALPAAIEVASYHVVLEAVSNAVRHGGARHVRARLGREPEALTLEVRDDGRGMAGDAPPGVGLRSIRARVEELGGELSVESCGTGTVVRGMLPLEEDR